MPQTLKCCIGHKVWVPPAAGKYGDSSHSTNSFSSSTSKPSESLEMPSVAHKKLLAGPQDWKTEKPFPAGCHNPDPEVSLQN